ncbi:heavy metal translocating P-type ATPase [Paraliomyxa miuraensis]|uniref:heavy metal translocating P-type ATPase n=1 Tax=Paraliomyxa miuraensis TaxID=376150 RepID=UPI00224EE1CB|nr:heavy metal translocating P-type ATPase [Paraliomyxa miuraensis]MCX4246655.1 heavy metal translocating P-type ATPase [Paraliomyxa miuraensis]
MSWWTELRDFGLELIQDLDAIADRVSAAVSSSVAPAVQRSAGNLDRALARIPEQVGPSLVRQALVLDRRYQEFMVRRVDPLFGQARNQHLEEMGGFEISPREVMLNRQIAFCASALLALVAGRLLAPATLLVTVPASFTLTFPAFKMAAASVKKQRRITYHVVSIISMTAIWLRGLYIPALAGSMAFYLGEKLLMVTEDRSHKGLIAVFSQQPRSVIVLEGGREVERALERISAGDIVVVHAGGFMPVDGVVVNGMATIDQHMLTGEAQPAEKSPGDSVYASTVVLAGKLHVRVASAGTETVAAKIGEVLNKTASYQLALQSKGSEIAHSFAVPTLALSGLALATVGPDGALAAINSALGVSVRMSGPVAMLNLLNIASHNGILLKDGRSLDLLSDIDTVVFDKTGTLTLTRPNVARVIPLEGFDETSMITLAAAAERDQTHPIALAILAEAEARGLEMPAIDHARYEIGYGIKVTVGERLVRVGSERFMTAEGVALSSEIIEIQRESHAGGHTLVLIAVDDQLAGAIELQPTIRPEADEVIASLRQRGLAMVVISGDQDEPTRRLAERLGMDRYFANILPEGKANLVEQLQREGHMVCFVGDGINDSIALKKSNISVSLRGATTVATDSAQVVLMQESLRQLPFLFELGDDMERCLRLGTYAGTIPGGITIGGVFLFGWGFYHALGLSMLSLAASLGIAMYPLHKHRRLATNIPALEPDPLALPAST